jgi:HK97 family phage portal protein
MGFLDRFASAWRTANTDTQRRSFAVPSRTVSQVDRPVGTADALSLGSVYRAVNIIAVAAAQLPWRVIQNGLEVEATTFVQQPDPQMHRAAFIEQTVNAMALNGNAFWRLGRNSRNEVVTAENLNPAYVAIEVDREGRTIGYTYQGTKRYTLDEIKHVPLFRVPGNARGISPIDAANKELRGHIDLSAFASDFFHNGGMPLGLLKTDVQLTQEDAQQAKEWWNESASAANGIAVMGNGLMFEKTGLTPAEAQSAELRKLSATEVARLFGVPASLMLADAGSSLTYSNLQQEWVAFVRFGLTKYTLEIENAMSSLIPNRTKEVRFIYDALLRPDTEARYRAHTIALNGEPFMTADEVRLLEDLPPLGGN